LYGYQNKGVAWGAIRIVIKTKGQKLGVYRGIDFGETVFRLGGLRVSWVRAGLVGEYHVVR
jgi:hypothetical protein